MASWISGCIAVILHKIQYHVSMEQSMNKSSNCSCRDRSRSKRMQQLVKNRASMRVMKLSMLQSRYTCYHASNCLWLASLADDVTHSLRYACFGFFECWSFHLDDARPMQQLSDYLPSLAWLHTPLGMHSYNTWHKRHHTLCCTNWVLSSHMCLCSLCQEQNSTRLFVAEMPC